MKRSINFTDRKRLDNTAFELEVFERNNGPSELQIKMHETCMPKMPVSPIEATTWIEAYRGTRVMRFKMGLRAYRERSKRLPLSQFDPNEPLLFRIKVVDQNDKSHPILAWRDRIRPLTYASNGQKKKSVLPVLPCDLGSVAWEIDWTEPLRPVLKVNSRINEAQNVTSIVKNDPDFAALVFPAVVKEVLTGLLLRENADTEEDSDQNEWLIFGTRLAGYGCPRNEEDEENDREKVDVWIKDVVHSFASEADLIQRYVRFKEKG